MRRRRSRCRAGRRRTCVWTTSRARSRSRAPATDRRVYPFPVDFVGVDGCRAGWIAIAFDESDAHSHLVTSTIADVARRYPSGLVLVDIPIGLRDTERDERRCDLEARVLLGPRASSVFPAPCRAALGLATYREASDE